METKVITPDFFFVNEYKSTRNGFSHKSTLFQNSVKQWYESCSYINRTWERYTYQTSMKKCVECLIQYEHKELIDEFKRTSGKSRTTKQEKDSVFQSSERIKQLTDLLNLL